MAVPIPEVDRRRLLEVRGLHPAVPVLVLHPLLTVVTGFGRDASDTVVECLGRLGAPLGPSVSGTVEIGGRILELPGALSDPDSRPEVVRGPMIVSELGRRRAAAAAADVSQRAARVSRREAALARRDQLVDRLDRLSSRADALERRLDGEEIVDDGEIERLVVAARLPDPATPNPIITGFADEWDTLVAERRATSGGPTVERAESNLAAVHARIVAREGLGADRPAAHALSAEGVARVQHAHAVVERIAAGLEDGRRAERRAAGRDVAEALEAERDALLELGFDSYAAFLLAMAEGRAEGDSSHDAAALVTAEAALVRARDRERAFVLLSERELDLRARVARLLGRLPGPDVGAELRAGRETALPSAGALNRLTLVLRSVGAPVGDDPLAAAERWLSTTGSRRAQHAALRAELAEIESEGSRLDEQLEQAENELSAAEQELIAGVTGTLAGREAPVVLASAEPDELTPVLKALLAPVGPPVVVGECFAEFTAPATAAVLDVLGELSHHRQVVVVTELDAVARWAEGLGIDAVVWTPIEAEAAEEALAARPETSETPEISEPAVTAVADVTPADASPVDASPPASAKPVVIHAVVAKTAVEQAANGVKEAPPAAADREPQPSRAAGPWKAQPATKRKRKAKNAPVAPPWEGRFDTSRERAIPSRINPAVPPPPGSEPLAVCARHNGVITRMRCARCAQPACDECLVTPRGYRKAVCIECAIIESGVRKRRRQRG